MRQFLFDMIGFFFPVYCPVCKLPMYVPGQFICLKCELGMPKTNFTKDKDNPVSQIFWGRVQIEGATSLFRFEKGSKYQSLMHLLKYKGRQAIGIFLGKLLGLEIKESPFCNVDYIIPVPLHIQKEKQRGYNQSEIIARGISLITGIPINTRVIYRKKYTESQTRKNRYERWENMENVFCLCDHSESFTNSTFLLVDDVITTGSTLEACSTILLSIPGSRLFIATIAYA